jgi:hypothetical protein
VDVRPTQFVAGLQSVDLGGLLRSVGQARSDLDRALEASRQGQVDPQAHERAEKLAAAMSTPVPSDLAGTADEATLDRAEAALGFALPAAIRRSYGEVANGGFGPGAGLLPIERGGCALPRAAHDRGVAARALVA